MKKEEREKEIKYHEQEAIRIQRELDNLGSEFAEDGIVRIVLRDRIEQEKQYANSRKTSGPGSMTCDVAGNPTLETCKTCWGTGGCRYGKTDKEWKALVKRETMEWEKAYPPYLQ